MGAEGPLTPRGRSPPSHLFSFPPWPSGGLPFPSGNNPSDARPHGESVLHHPRPGNDVGPASGPARSCGPAPGVPAEKGEIRTRPGMSSERACSPASSSCSPQEARGPRRTRARKHREHPPGSGVGARAGTTRTPTTRIGRAAGRPAGGGATATMTGSTRIGTATTGTGTTAIGTAAMIGAAGTATATTTAPSRGVEASASTAGSGPAPSSSAMGTAAIRTAGTPIPTATRTRMARAPSSSEMGTDTATTTPTPWSSAASASSRRAEAGHPSKARGSRDAGLGADDALGAASTGSSARPCPPAGNGRAHPWSAGCAARPRRRDGASASRRRASGGRGVGPSSHPETFSRAGAPRRALPPVPAPARACSRF